MNKCDHLIAFVDGGLPPDQADSFRNHLATCQTCQADLVEALMAEERLSALKPADRR